VEETRKRSLARCSQLWIHSWRCGPLWIWPPMDQFAQL
jgi:hypothetical protein